MAVANKTVMNHIALIAGQDDDKPARVAHWNNAPSAFQNSCRSKIPYYDPEARGTTEILGEEKSGNWLVVDRIRSGSSWSRKRSRQVYRMAL